MDFIEESNCPSRSSNAIELIREILESWSLRLSKTFEQIRERCASWSLSLSKTFGQIRARCASWSLSLNKTFEQIRARCTSCCSSSREKCCAKGQHERPFKESFSSILYDMLICCCCISVYG